MKMWTLIAAILMTSCAHRQVQTQSHLPADVPTYTVRSANYEDSVSAVGRVGGVNGNQTNLSFLVAGVISNVYVRIGDHVSSGQPVAALDGRGYDLAAAQARSDVSVADANARAAGVDRFSTRIAVDDAAVRRASSLFEAGVAPRKDVDAAKAQLALDQADATVSRDQSKSLSAAVSSAQIHAALADRDVQNSVLRAPQDGVVSAIMHRAGENVDPSVPVIALSQVGTADITLNVPAASLSEIRLGDRVQFSIVGTRLQSDGIVTGVSNSIDPATQTGTVVARGAPTNVPIGSIVQANIVIASIRGLVVPETAVVQDPQTGNTLVFVVARDKQGDAIFQDRVVKVQMHNGSTALISTGLHVGERIATRGGFMLLAPTETGGD